MMAASHRELDSFLQKFKYLTSAGFKASISFKSENCCTRVTLDVDLPFLTPPCNLSPPSTPSQSPRNRSPSYYRRLRRRHDAREQCFKMNESEENKCVQPQVVPDAEMPQDEIIILKLKLWKTVKSMTVLVKIRCMMPKLM